VLDFLRERLSEDGLSVYPEYVEAKPELAAFFGVSPEELIFTNGTDEAIQVLVNTYVDRGGDVFLLRPSYAMYRFYAEVAGATIREIDYRPSDLAFPLERFWTPSAPTPAPSSSPIPTIPPAPASISTAFCVSSRRPATPPS